MTTRADRLAIPPTLLDSLFHHLDGTTPPPVTTINRTPIEGSRS
jgi:hypothetical protein